MRKSTALMPALCRSITSGVSAFVGMTADVREDPTVATPSRLGSHVSRALAISALSFFALPVGTAKATLIEAPVLAIIAILIGLRAPPSTCVSANPYSNSSAFTQSWKKGCNMSAEERTRVLNLQSKSKEELARLRAAVRVFTNAQATARACTSSNPFPSKAAFTQSWKNACELTRSPIGLPAGKSSPKGRRPTAVLPPGGLLEDDRGGFGPLGPAPTGAPASTPGAAPGGRVD